MLPSSVGEVVAPAVHPSTTPLALDLATLQTVLRVLTILALVGVIVLVVRALVFVDENEVVVFTDDDGDVAEVLETGIHYVSPLRTGGRTVETSPVGFELGGGRTETDDGVTVTGRVSGRIQVVDPEALVEGTRTHPGDVQRRIDEAYVTQIGYLPWAEIDEDPAVLEEACCRELEPALERWGVELQAFEVESIRKVD